MKKRISIIALIVLMSANLMAQKNKAADNSCGSCGLAVSGIFAFKYITDNNLNYKVTDCVPFSDIEMYSMPSGGAVMAYATADEKGEAVISLSEKIPVAFALNHNRVNEQGISGKGQIYNLTKDPVLDIESPVLNADNANSVTVNWKANSYGARWNFNVQRSLDGKNFTNVAVKASGNASAVVSYTIQNEITESLSGTVYYRIEAQNKETGAKILTSVKELGQPKPVLFTAVIYNNQIRIHCSNTLSYPATYTLTDMQGTKITTGILKTDNQIIDINSYQVKNYILSVTDRKNNFGSQMLLKN